ncbi:MAG: hypothetical protein IT376_15705 [Polyangiaceae bacterium]|nr:hypothetical protein [Polyangiaceae bacterium]
MPFRSPLLLALALLGCESPDTARDPVWGKQPCGACAMLVSEPPHAGQLVTRDGVRVYFDDVGCMAGYVVERRVDPAHLWVRDASGAWVDARTARFESGAKTPMNYGFSPAPTGAATWSDVEAAARARGGAR